MTEQQTEWYDILTGYMGSNEAVDMVLAINGTNDETFSDMLYYLTGYRDFKEYEKESNENWD